MKFLTRVYAFWLAPAVTLSYSIGNLPVREADTAAFHLQAHTQAELSESHVAFNVPCQADDEAFDFSFQIVKESSRAACTSSTVLVNGQGLDLDWSSSGWPQNSQGRSNVSVISTINQQNHTLELSSQSLCLSSFLAGSTNSPLPATKGDAVQITFVYIEGIDGRPSRSRSGFTVSFDHSSQQVVGLLTAPEEPAPTLEEGSESVPVVSETSTAEEPVSGSDVNDESLKLEYLENELDALTAAVKKQKAVVEASRGRNNRSSTKERCFTSNLIEGARRLLRLATMQSTPKWHKESVATIDPDCYYTHSRQARMSAAKNHEKLCTGQNAGNRGQVPPPLSDNSSPHRSFSSSTDSDSQSSRSDTIHSILAPIGVAAGFLCLSCFAVHLHRNCCSPRARAERAAHREERRTKRQYDRLARQHKWRTWWYRRTGRNDQAISNDYEEKRSLIRAQEQRLEDAMQQEIRRIRNEHGYFDEEAGAIPQESLPPYRSRAGSGRPPSYTSEPAERFPAPTVVSSLVNDITSGLEDGPIPPSSPVSDITPDSSVANLSRRNSSDTLHSERSVV